MGLLPFPDIRKTKMPFKKFISIGSVAVLQSGPSAGKIAAIVDVIDQNRVLIDGPCSEVPRQEFPIKDLHLTSLKAKFPFSARSRVVSKAWKSEDISGKWAASSWAKRMQAKNRRSSLNDFDRFKPMKAKSARNKILNKAVNVQKRKLPRPASCEQVPIAHS